MERFLRFCLSLSLAAVACVSYAAGAVGFVTISDIDFLSNPDMTDRHWFYKDSSGNPIPAPGGGKYNSSPEVLFGRSGDLNAPAVTYVRGTQASVKLTLRNGVGLPEVAGTVSCDGGSMLQAVPYFPYLVTVPISASIANGAVTLAPNFGTDDVTVNFTLPNFVLKGPLWLNLTWDLKRTDNNATVGGPLEGFTWNKVFVVDSTPALHQSKPWAELLDFGCDWASGAAGPDEVTSYLCRGLFHSLLMKYNLNDLGVPTLWIDDILGKFRLKDLLNNGSPAPGNCVDVSCFLSLLSSAQGHSGGLKQLALGSPPGFSRPWSTTFFCPIGSNALDASNYMYTAFTMHQQFWLNGKVYDSALAYDRTVISPFGVHNEPSCELSPAGGWPSAFYPASPSYWQTVTGLGGLQGVVGHCLRPLAPSEYSFIPPTNDIVIDILTTHPIHGYEVLDPIQLANQPMVLETPFTNSVNFNGVM